MKYLRKVLLLLTAATFFFVPLTSFATPNDGGAEAFQKGREFHQRYKYKQAREMYLIAAEQGNGEAKMYLAILYRYGNGVEKSVAQSDAWLQKAADEGYAEAQHQVANKYRYKSKSNPNHSNEKAIFWFLKAANQGYVESQNVIGEMYEKGDGVAKYAQQAAPWIKEKPPESTLVPGNFPKAECQRAYTDLFAALFGKNKKPVSELASKWALEWEKSERAGATSCNTLPSEFHTPLGKSETASAQKVLDAALRKNAAMDRKIAAGDIRDPWNFKDSRTEILETMGKYSTTYVQDCYRHRNYAASSSISSAGIKDWMRMYVIDQNIACNVVPLDLVSAYNAQANGRPAAQQEQNWGEALREVTEGIAEREANKKEICRYNPNGSKTCWWE